MASPLRHRVPALLVATATALGALAGARDAHAQFDTHDRRNGVEAAFDLGYGWLANRGAFCRTDVSRCADGRLGGSIGTQVHVGYQIVPFFSLGFHFTYNAFTSDAADANTQAGGTNTAFGLYLRAHLLTLLDSSARSTTSNMDLYFSVGFDFIGAVGDWFNLRVGGSYVNNEITTWGFQFPFTVGFDYAVHPNVSIGAMAQLSPVTYDHQHFDTAFGSGNDNTPRSGDVYFFLGLGAKLHFNVL